MTTVWAIVSSGRVWFSARTTRDAMDSVMVVCCCCSAGLLVRPYVECTRILDWYWNFVTSLPSVAFEPTTPFLKGSGGCACFGIQRAHQGWLLPGSGCLLVVSWLVILIHSVVMWCLSFHSSLGTGLHTGVLHLAQPIAMALDWLCDDQTLHRLDHCRKWSVSCIL